MEFEKFLGVMDVLLGENGCPWDREQTHESLRQYMLEECYEAIDAIDCGDMNALRDELGDVLLQVVFHAKLAEKAGAFGIDDVIKSVSDKLVSRHTHIFGEEKANDVEDVKRIWEANKEKEREGSAVSAMNSVPKALPALVRAAKVIKRSKKELPPAEEIITRIDEQLKNTAVKDIDFGNILLSLAALSNILDINAEFSLTKALEAFINTESKSFFKQ
ncbi:MAG: MazG family protein [Defluviitaleaceae bacterium]|nr:MazG family protein [Defluviitaleaceae bacterium]MCL2262423.1 MazG family protein [Defluviitaleaceae bacterium]